MRFDETSLWYDFIISTEIASILLHSTVESILIEIVDVLSIFLDIPTKDSAF